MPQFIKQLVADLRAASLKPDAYVVSDLRVVVKEQLDKLRPEDFLPAAQAEVVKLRHEMERLCKRPALSVMKEFVPFADGLLQVLDQYQGASSGGLSRSFAFVADADLRTIIERDYRELELCLLPGGAWKSAVVMSGSILEALLYDQLTRDSGRVYAAMASSKAPKKKGGATKDITNDTLEDQWTLKDLIDASVDLGVVPQGHANAIHQVLRDYRNFVHPKKEVKSQHPCTEAEATAAKGTLDIVCNYLTP